MWMCRDREAARLVVILVWFAEAGVVAWRYGHPRHPLRLAQLILFEALLEDKRGQPR